MSNLPVLRMPNNSVRLPDSDQWTNRFEIKAESSTRIYTVAQHKKGRYWGCSCPGWKAHRRCKHLTEIGLPNHQRPHEVQLKEAS
jgi:hypothetical protein